MNEFICRVSYCNYPEGQCLGECDQIYPLLHRAPCDKLEYKDMSNNTSQALRLARMIEFYNAGVESQRIFEDYQQAADELRHLYFENEKLRAALAEQPAEQQPLTREEIFEIAEPFGEFKYGDAQGHKRIEFARAIERAHGIGEHE